MQIVVQKFGGTSVATVEQQQYVATQVLKTVQEGHSVVVVVSAMGRKGDPYATDTLLSLIEETEKHVPRRDRDLLMSCGEIISAVRMGGLLRQMGLNVAVLTGGQAGIKTTSDFANARIFEVDTKRLRSLLEDGKCVVVAGFQGKTLNGDVTTLGRGGSDTTAVALGLALDASRVEIYTDVEGIMTADPKVEPNAKVLREISYEEVLQMAQKGARVIHPRAVELAMQQRIPIYVTTTSARNSGTVISDGTSPNRNFEGERVRTVTAVAHLTGLVQFQLPPLEFEQARNVYKHLARAGVDLDLIHISTERHKFVVKAGQTEKAEEICASLGLDPQVQYNVAKVSAIGAAMHGVPGVMAGIVQALTDAGIKILQTSDSHLTISCLVHGEDTVSAVKALHNHFKLERV